MRHLQIFVVVAGLSMAPSIVFAQVGAPQRPALPSEPQRPQPPVSPQQSSPGRIIQEMPDARETQSRLNEIFRQHPPSVREVLRIDPTLLYRAGLHGQLSGACRIPGTASGGCAQSLVLHRRSPVRGTQQHPGDRSVPNDLANGRAPDGCHGDWHHHRRHPLSGTHHHRSPAVATGHARAKRAPHEADRSLRVERRSASPTCNRRPARR